MVEAAKLQRQFADVLRSSGLAGAAAAEDAEDDERLRLLGEEEGIEGGGWGGGGSGGRGGGGLGRQHGGRGGAAGAAREEERHRRRLAAQKRELRDLQRQRDRRAAPQSLFWRTCLLCSPRGVSAHSVLVLQVALRLRNGSARHVSL